MRSKMLVIAGFALLAACAPPPPHAVPEQQAFGAVSSSAAPSAETAASSAGQETNGWQIPLPRAEERMTKKHFGMFISPEDSPVEPERFTGYHTGTDFELLPGEHAEHTVVSAACAGQVLLREWIGGYGGVVIQRCTLHGETVTALYGHVSLASVTASPGDLLAAGDAVGTLGAAYSSETDGERAHLHFSIHKGSGREFRGYVRSAAELSDWADPAAVLGIK